MSYTPVPEDKFSFGLWTVSNRGRDPFGEAVRPPLSPVDAVAMLGDAGTWGVNLHDNDLVPIDATPAERDRIVAEFRRACTEHGVVVRFDDGVHRAEMDMHARIRGGRIDQRVERQILVRIRVNGDLPHPAE